MSTLRLAWRELRRDRARGLRLPAVLLAVAVAALTATRGFESAIRQTLDREARTLAGSDLEIGSPRPLPDSELAQVEHLLPDGTRHASIRDFLSMASRPGSGLSRLVEVRAASAGFPFYGALELEPSLPADRALEMQASDPLPPLLAQPALLSQLGLKLGDTLRLGQQVFRLRAVVRKEAGLGGSAFSLGPRVWIALRDLPATGLAGPTSRVRYRETYALRDAAEAPLVALRAEIQKRLQDPAERARTWREANPQLRGFYLRLSEFLGLLGLFVALLGGVGIAAAMRSHLRARLTQVAVLRCLGATRGQLRAYLFAQATLLATAGSVLGALAGVALTGVLPRLLGELGDLPGPGQVPLSAPAEAMAIGLGLTWLFAWIGLAELPGIRPLLLLRPGSGVRAPTGPRIAAISATLVFALLLGLRQAGYPGGVWSVAGTIGFAGLLFALLLGVIRALEQLTPRLTGLLSFPRRYGLRNFFRLRAQSALTVTVLSIAVLLLGSATLIRQSMLDELRAGVRAERPSLFLIDIGNDQRPQLEALAKRAEAGAGEVRLSFAKLIPARLSSVNQAPPSTEGDADNRSREFRLTERATLYSTERVVAGRFWTGPVSGPLAEASVEKSWAERSGVHLGDRLDFDIQGVTVAARVTSVRTVQWTTFQPNFFVVLQPGSLEGAPFTWIASVGGPGARQAKGPLQASLARELPTLSAIDIDEASDRLASIIGRIDAGVRFVSLFTLAAGLLVLALVAADSALRRSGETALLKVLGGGRAALSRALSTEFVASALLTVLWGGLGASLVSRWAIAPRFGLETPFLSRGLAWLLAGTAAGIWATGRWASRRTFRVSPAQILKDS